MDDFEDHLAGLDEAVAEGVGTAAVLLRVAGGDPVPCRVILELPTGTDQLEAAPMIRDKPYLEAPVYLVPQLVKGDVFIVKGRRYQVASKPARPGDGRWWTAVMADLGPA